MALPPFVRWGLQGGSAGTTQGGLCAREILTTRYRLPHAEIPPAEPSATLPLTRGPKHVVYHPSTNAAFAAKVIAEVPAGTSSARPRTDEPPPTPAVWMISMVGGRDWRDWMESGVDDNAGGKGLERQEGMREWRV